MTSEPTADQYPICAGCDCPDGRCECVECTEYKWPFTRLRDLPRDERRAILEHAANEAAESGMYAEPTAESFAERGRQLLLEQSVTVGKTGNDAIVSCDTPEDATAVWHFLESLAGVEPTYT